MIGRILGSPIGSGNAGGYILSGHIAYRVDASLEVTRSGVDVSGWGDQSDGNRDASQGTGSLQPDFVSGAVNGLPAIKGDSVDDFMALSSSLIINNDFAVFAVVGDHVGPQYMFGHSSTIYTRILNASTTWRNSTVHSFDHSNKLCTTAYMLHHIARFSGQVRSYRNNLESLTGAIANAVQYAIAYLFSYGAANYGYGGLAELIILDGTIVPADITYLVNLLNTKYNLGIT